jgi:hypothetical protein
MVTISCTASGNTFYAQTNGINVYRRGKLVQSLKVFKQHFVVLYCV